MDGKTGATAYRAEFTAGIVGAMAITEVGVTCPELCLWYASCGEQPSGCEQSA